MNSEIKVGDTMLVKGAGPFGNPLLFTVEKITKRHIEFRTVMGNGKCTIEQWRD